MGKPVDEIEPTIDFETVFLDKTWWSEKFQDMLYNF